MPPLENTTALRMNLVGFGSLDDYPKFAFKPLQK